MTNSPAAQCLNVIMSVTRKIGNLRRKQVEQMRKDCELLGFDWRVTCKNIIISNSHKCLEESSWPPLKKKRVILRLLLRKRWSGIWMEHVQLYCKGSLLGRKWPKVAKWNLNEKVKKIKERKWKKLHRII